MNPDDAKLIHAAFTEESGSEPNYRVHERAYHDYLATGYTVADLRMVMRYLKSENKQMNGAKHSLRLDRLLDFDYRRFDSLLNCARAKERNKVKPATPRETILHDWRGVKPETNGNGHCRPISEVFNAIREATRQ